MVYDEDVITDEPPGWCILSENGTGLVTDEPSDWCLLSENGAYRSGHR